MHYIAKFKLAVTTLGTLICCAAQGHAHKPSIEHLDINIISYEELVQGDEEALNTLETALYKKGIVGVRGIPGYKEKVTKFIDAARQFSALPEEIKNGYAPNYALGEFLGYDQGKEQFKRPDGTWVIDDLKTSYYALVPNVSDNKWPNELDLKTPFQKLGHLMAHVGKKVMKRLRLIGPATGISVKDSLHVGRMLYYKKSTDSAQDNPFWCGAHFDHGMFTALIPAFYFVHGEPVAEPEEAGLFVKTGLDENFKKVVANDPDVMLFQVGEFGQLVSNDAICATEHRVHKANGNIERYTMALFFSAPLDTVIYSQSKLTQDARYGNDQNNACSYGQWHTASLDRYRVEQK